MQFFIDFDGTITKQDAVDLILEHFASCEWRKIEQAWVDGKIGSRECLTRQIALVKVTKEEFKKLDNHIEVDPTFFSFLKTAENLGIPVTIVSDGFRIMIEQILKHASKNLKGAGRSWRIFSNQLEWHGSRVEVRFPDGPLCGHGCANCKPRVIASHRILGKKIIFVGDGLSDRFAAEAADLTFAKGGAHGHAPLQKFCEEKHLAYKAYTNFKEIEKWVLKQSVEIKEGLTCR